MKLRADLHNHSCLSPCGDLEMSPRAMAERASELGIGILALTDHNTSANCPAFDHWCRKLGILPVFGMEVTTVEELHVLALFGSLKEVADLDSDLFPRYRSVKNRPEKWGDQVIVDADNMIVGEIELHLTSGAMDISLTELARDVSQRGGMCIPAHIDRSSTSVSSQLGALPPGEFSAVELIRLPPPIGIRNLPIICDSDAHYLDDMGQRFFTVDLLEVDFASLKAAIESNNLELSIR